jgi:PBP1b-binding outer membrane lipoprotein LpoB
MKVIVVILLLLSVACARAQIVATNALSLQSVATTTVNGTAFSLGGISIPKRQHIIQHNGIAGQTTNNIGTNSLTVTIQLSFDNTNWTTISTYNPALTNATVDLFAPSTHDITCYMRAQAVTTNTVTVGVTTIAP